MRALNEGHFKFIMVSVRMMAEDNPQKLGVFFISRICMTTTNGENERLAVVENEVKNINRKVDDLKNNDIKEIRDSVKGLPDELVRRFDERYTPRDQFQGLQIKFTEMQETIDPLTKLRRHIWWVVVASIVVASVGVDIIKSKLGF